MYLKKHKALFIVGGIFILLALIYLALVSGQGKSSKDTGEDQIQVTDLGDLSAFRFTDSQSGTSMSFVKDGDTWYAENDREIPLDQTYLDAMENTYASLNATREIDQPDELSDYGLTEPAYTVEATDQDGNTTTFSIGNAASDDYYLTVNQASSPVYTVDSTAVSVLQYDLDTLVKKDSLPSIGSGNLVKAQITENGQTSSYSSDDDSQSETISTIAGGYGAMTLSELASYHATADELNQFGLNEENRTTVVLTYTSSSDDSDDTKTFTIYIGQDTGDGSRYVQVQDSSLVYKVSSSILNNLLGVGNSEDS